MSSLSSSAERLSSLQATLIVLSNAPAHNNAGHFRNCRIIVAGLSYMLFDFLALPVPIAPESFWRYNLNHEPLYPHFGPPSSVSCTVPGRLPRHLGRGRKRNRTEQDTELVLERRELLLRTGQP